MITLLYNRYFIFFVGPLLFSFSGCTSKPSSEQETQWLIKKLPQKEYLDYTSIQSKEVDFLTVAYNRSRTAINDLENKKWIKLNEELATYYTGQLNLADKNHGKLKPYLVRGVISNDLGSYHVSFTQSGNLIVLYSSTGPVEYRRWPLVVFLEESPKQVFVMETGSM